MLARVLVCCAAALAAGAAGGCGDAVVDPGNVRVVDLDTSAAQEGWAVNYPKQRKLLFMVGRLWVFYSDGRDARVRSTVDGATLSDAQLVREGMVFGHRCSYAFDGASVHYACCEALPGADVFYRRGTPHADGTIAWGAEQTAFDVPDAQSVLYPKVVLDAAGRAWVAFMLFEGGFETAPQSAMVTRSSRRDGTWATDAGFPTALVRGATQTFPDVMGVALASGGTYWVYDPDGEQSYRGRAFRDESGWGAEEEVTTSHQRHGLFDLAAAGDVVHLAHGGDGTVHYRRRSAAGRWSDEVYVGGNASGHVSVAALGTERARVTWLSHDGRRVLAREVGAQGAAAPAQLVLDAGSAGLAGMRLGINLNGLAAPAGPFGAAVVTTLGSAPPFRIVLATAPP